MPHGDPLTEKATWSWERLARRIRVPLGFAFAAVFLALARPSPRSLAGGLLLVVPGLLLRAYAAGYVRKNAELTTTGPYAFTRNPLYLGSMLAAYGFTAASRRWELTLLLTALFLLIYLPVILSEERYLRAHFPAFDRYAERVPRLLPSLLRLLARHPSPPSKAERGSFSRALYVKHREYNALVGAVLLYAVLAGLFLVRAHAGAR